MVDARPEVVERRRVRRRRRRLVLGAILLILCGLAATGGTYVYDKYRDAAGPAQDGARDFLTELREGNVTAAYERLCRRARTDYSLESFTRGAATPRLVGFEMTGAEVSVGGGSFDARVTAKLTYDNGFAPDQTIRVVEEDGRWKVCGSPY